MRQASQGPWNPHPPERSLQKLPQTRRTSANTFGTATGGVPRTCQARFQPCSHAVFTLRRFHLARRSRGVREAFGRPMKHRMQGVYVA